MVEVSDRVRRAVGDRARATPGPQPLEVEDMGLEDWLKILAVVADRAGMGYHFLMSGGMPNADNIVARLHGGNEDWSFVVAPGARDDSPLKAERNADVNINEIEPRKAVVAAIDAILDHEQEGDDA